MLCRLVVLFGWCKYSVARKYLCLAVCRAVLLASLEERVDIEHTRKNARASSEVRCRYMYRALVAQVFGTRCPERCTHVRARVHLLSHVYL